MVIYYQGKGNWHFLTDEMFLKAQGSWEKGNSAFFEEFKMLLPPPKQPVCCPTEHNGLELAFTVKEGFAGTPGWIGIQRPVRKNGTELKRAAVYARMQDHSADEGRWVWKELNPRNPNTIDTVPTDLTSEEVKAACASLEPIPVDEVLKDPELRGAVPWQPLLADYMTDNK